MDHHAARGSLLRSFERHLRARNRSDRTVGNYLESARLAEAVLAARGKQLEEATQADLEDFLGELLFLLQPAIQDPGAPSPTRWRA
jgi:hypothetical protein